MTVNSVGAQYQQHAGHKITTYIKHAARATADLTKDVVTTLGARGLDGQPLALKVLAGLAKVLKDWDQYDDDYYANGVTKFVEYAGKPLANIGAVFAPLTGFEGLVDDVGSCAHALLNGEVEKKVNMVVKVKDTKGAEKTYKFENKIKTQASGLAKAESMIKATATLSGWLSDVANAVSKIAELNFFKLEEAFLARVSLVGSLCARVFAYVGAGGTIIKFGLSAYHLWNAKNVSKDELDVLKTSFHHATIGLVKTAMRISLLVFASYLSLSFQGALALTMVGMDIYANRTKKQAQPTMEICVQMAPSAVPAA
jgi:hypothetical protein